ncbi:MAG: VPLPA-CTERM sorting domain-containing protein [Gammaproteobacteria bacterium]
MKNFKFCLAAILLTFSSAAFASSVTFDLGNHEAGGLYDGSTNPYGLRLDDTDQTFTVGDNLPGTYSGAEATITFDPADLAAGAVLVGTIIDNATGAVWDVTYSMTGLTAAANGGFIAAAGSGTVTEQLGPGVFTLVGMSDGTGVFIFDDDGHRIVGSSSGWVGRGWFEGTGSNDFLVVGTPSPQPVPLPAAFWLLGTGLVSLFGLKRRK